LLPLSNGRGEPNFSLGRQERCDELQPHRNRIGCYTLIMPFKNQQKPRRTARCIYRIDHNKSHTHSWFVSIQRRGRVYCRHFTDSVYGGNRKALEAAKVFRDSLSRLKPFSRPEVCRIRKRNNRSGISGVTRIDAWENSRGRRVHRRYWLVQWPVGNGKAGKKKFSIKQYGEREARQRAMKARRQALKRLASVA